MTDTETTLIENDLTIQRGHGILRKTERTRTNPSPRRKGGLIRIWEVTDYGIRTAEYQR